MQKEKIFLNAEGHLTIRDGQTGEILVNTHNAINPENLSVAITQSIIGGPLNPNNNGLIYSMNFGNGGTTVDASGVVLYNPPNTSSATSKLYNQTYLKIVNNQFSSDLDTANNNLVYSHVPGKAYSDIIVTCNLDYGEPNNQLAFDNANDINSEYAFDEMGIFTYNGQMLTHVIFSPTLKSLNRTMNFTYIVRISTITALSA